jgi:hypothetical protein
VKTRANRVGEDGIVYVWHWFACATCGEAIHIRQDGLKPEAVRPGCCGGVTVASPRESHTTSDLLEPARGLCMACGYKKKFGAPPASGAEETDMAKVKGKGGAPSAKSKANGKGGKGQRSLPAKGPKGEERVFKRRYHQDLPVEVDVEFRTAKGRELADVCDEQRAIEDERRTVMAGFRKRLSHVSERAKELSAIVRQGTKTQSVQCEDFLLPTNEIETVRLDTGKVVLRRAARADELQLPLRGAEGDPNDDDDGEDETPPEPPFGSPDQGSPKAKAANANGSADAVESTP